MVNENRQITKKTLKLLGKHLNLHINDNAEFSEEDHFRVLIHAAIQNISLEESSAQLNILKKKAPSPDATQYHLKKNDAVTLEHQLDSILQANVATLKKRRALSRKRDVAIDFHDMPWYGKPNSWTVGGKHREGTSYFVRFATLEIVERGERLCLKIIPVTQFKSKERVVKELLDFAFKLGIRIHRLYFDRAFPGTRVIKVVERFGIDWIAALTKNEKVKAAIKDAHINGDFVREYQMGTKNDNVTFNLVILKSKKYSDHKAKVTEKYNAFATNIPVEEGEAERVIESYRKRWGIETGYRVKREFRIKTSTRVYSMKILYFFLSVVMYNLWVLLNLDALVLNAEFEKPLITTDRMKFYYQLELFCPSVFEKDEEYAQLHRKWVEEGLALAKIQVFV